MTLEKGAIYCRANNLNLIRLIAATSVTFGHSFAMTHGSHYNFLWSINSAGFGFYAVAIFFGLSGFLITQSYLRNSNWKVYLKARLLRLVPGYLFANILTALIIVFIMKSDWTLLFSKEFYFYIVGSAFTAKWSFPDVFAHLHYNSTNGSMWTLPYEFLMYIHVLLLGFVGVLRKKYVALAIGFFLLGIAAFKIDVLFNPLFSLLFRIKAYDPTYLALPFSFGVGILFFLFKEKIRLSLTASLGILAVSAFTDGWLIKVLAWVYFTFCFAYIPKYYIKKLNFRNDISYGIYILSWPIQQTILHLKLTDNPVCLFFYSMIAVVPLAFASWKLIEKPSLSLKTLTH
jgi:peptidoglycan/LPS O-acetylase OafA/YrhL